MSDDLIDGLSKLPGVRTYTDKDGKFHMTTKTVEQEEKEKEEKLNYEFGWKCDECQQRKKETLKNAPDGRLLCKSCYDIIWDEKSTHGMIIFHTQCPFCSKELILKDEKGECDCGAIYDGGFLDEFYYGYRFYKKKC